MLGPVGAEGQVASRMVTLSVKKFVVARSGRPSRLKSPTANAKGLVPGWGEVAVAVKLPVPSPIRIVTLLETKFAVARSGLPSRLKSPTTTERGELPTASGEVPGISKSPLPRPKRIDTLLEKKFAVA